MIRNKQLQFWGPSQSLGEAVAGQMKKAFSKTCWLKKKTLDLDTRRHLIKAFRKRSVHGEGQFSGINSVPEPQVFKASICHWVMQQASLKEYWQERDAQWTSHSQVKCSLSYWHPGNKRIHLSHWHCSQRQFINCYIIKKITMKPTNATSYSIT